MKVISKIVCISIILLVACSKDSNLSDIENSYLSIKEVKAYLPSNLFNDSKVVYKNINGDEWKLSTAAIESIGEKSFEEQSYKVEKFKINLYDPDNVNFSIVIVGSTNYVEGGGIIKGLLCFLMPFNESGTTWNTIYFENEKPTVRLGDSFIENYSIHNKDFKDTYVSIGKDNSQVQHSAYSELNINSDVGIVAFRDENNDLWVFDRFE